MRKAFISVLAIALALSIVGCQPAAEQPTGQTNQEQPAEQESNRADYLISQDEFDAEAAAVIDARSPDAYAAGHIPGAVNAPWQTFSNMEGAPGDPDWGTIVSPEQIADTLGELGIDASRPVVVYGDPTGWGEDGRVAWTLRIAGISDVRMLDGGYPAWEAAGGTPSTDAAQTEAVDVSAGGGDSSLTVDTGYLNDNLGTAVIVDTRSAKEFEGATDFGEARGGHIPGAVNIPYVELFNDNGTVKSDSELRAIFEDAGMQADDEIVFYCTAGIRSAHMTLVARMLGFENARNYDASFYAWAADESLPVE
jgi:thiosulfate/3-mercaptopyruvate sulfurtransferase